MFFFLQALSIRRIADQKSVFPGVAEFTDCPLLKMDEMIDPCALRVIPCHFYNLPINIIPLDIHRNIRMHKLARFLKTALPNLFLNQVVPLF